MSPYDPYAGGWVSPSWGWGGEWDWTKGDWRTGPDYQTANLAHFLNAILPMMRTKEDMLAAARQIGTLVGGRGPWAHYAGQTETTGTPLPTGEPGRAWAGQKWQEALGQIKRHPVGRPGGRAQRQNEAIRAWLQGLAGFGAQTRQWLGPTIPGQTRQQQRTFRQGWGDLLKQAPAGGEAYAPWLQRLFMPSVSRPMPGQYQFDPQAQRWQVQRQPRFF